jgi:serine/threonine-protein kinase
MASSADVSLPIPEPTGIPVPIGEVVAGKYRLERILGRSGMGIVYGGTHIGIDQPVAVKFLLVKGSTDEDALVRFTREAKFMAKISSEHVVRVIDVGALPDTTPFIVMEQLQGNDLSRQLRNEGPLPIETAVDYLLQACDGLATAHAAGVIHRDLKPSNLFLATLADGRQMVKLIDFGVAKYRGSGDGAPQNDSLTQTNVMIGSPRYMAPEQVRASRDVDARSDVWALGVILQELITGRPVFKGPTISDTFVLILTAEPLRADVIRPDVPAGLADVIARALSKDVTWRTPSVATFASELLPYVSPTRRMLFEPVFAGVGAPASVRTFSRADTSGPYAGFASGSFPQLPAAPEGEDIDVETRTAGGSVMPAKKRPKAVGLRFAISGGLVLVIAGVLAAFALKSGPKVDPRAAAAGPTAPSSAAAIPSAAPGEAEPPKVAAVTPSATARTASPPILPARAPAAPAAVTPATPAAADSKAHAGRPGVPAAKPSAGQPPASPPVAAPPERGGSLFDDPK